MAQLKLTAVEGLSRGAIYSITLQHNLTFTSHRSDDSQTEEQFTPETAYYLFSGSSDWLAIQAQLLAENTMLSASDITII